MFSLKLKLVFSCMRSSIGMAKSAMEAISGMQMFGVQSAWWSVVFVDHDAHNRNRTTLEHLLPRESNSKVFDREKCRLNFILVFVKLGVVYGERTDFLFNCTSV